MQRLKEVLKFLLRFQLDLHYHLSPTSLFILRCIVVTMCVCHILGTYYPRYEFIDAAHVGDKVMGKVKTYSVYGNPDGWR